MKRTAPWQRKKSIYNLLYKQYQLNFLSLDLLSSRPFHRSQNSIVINSVCLYVLFFFLFSHCAMYTVAFGFSIVWQRCCYYHRCWHRFCHHYRCGCCCCLCCCCFFLCHLFAILLLLSSSSMYYTYLHLNLKLKLPTMGVFRSL